MLITADTRTTLLVSGTGEVLVPDDDVVAVGSGGSYALAAARALLKHTELPAREIVTEGLAVAADIDIYTNDHITVEELTT
jgi:ATP-dependent HslUV protease subunit HslV